MSPRRPGVVDGLWRVGLFVAWRGLRLYWFVLRPRNLRGVCVAVWWDGRLLTVEHTYKSGLGMPAGGPRRREDPREAAARELCEEVGIEVAPEALRHLFDLPCEYRYVSEIVHYFELRPSREPEVRIDRREIRSARFRTPDEIEAVDTLKPLRIFLREWRRRAQAGEHGGASRLT